MKYSLLFFIFLTIILRGNAQVTLAISSQDIKMAVNPDSFEVKGRVTIKKTSNQTKKFTWQRSLSTITNGWYCLVCDKTNCWSAATGSPLDYIELAGGASINLDIFIRPEKKSGAATIDVKIFEQGNEANAVTSKITFSSNSKEKVVKTPDSNVSIYPNPAVEYFMISDNSNVEKVVIYNIIGRQMRSYKVTDGTKYYVNDLPDGIYIIRLLHANGTTLKTSRLSKARIKA